MARTPEQAAALLVANPTRLPGGEWGAWVRGDAAPGKIVRIETKAGKAWEARIHRVLWSGTCKTTGLPLHQCSTTRVTGSE